MKNLLSSALNVLSKFLLSPSPIKVALPLSIANVAVISSPLEFVPPCINICVLLTIVTSPSGLSPVIWSCLVPNIGGAGGAPVYVGSNAQRSPGGEGLLYSITGVSTSYSQGGNGGGVSSSFNYYKADPTTRGSGGRGGNGNGGGGADGYDGLVVIAYKGPQRGTGGVIDQVTRPGYTLHIFERPGPNLFVA